MFRKGKKKKKRDFRDNPCWILGTSEGVPHSVGRTLSYDEEDSYHAVDSSMLFCQKMISLGALRLPLELHSRFLEEHLDRKWTVEVGYISRCHRTVT